MINLKFSRPIAALAIVASFFSACNKVDKVDPIGGQGQTIVKIVDGGVPGIQKHAIDFVNTPLTFVGADIRRDIPNNEELQKKINVVVKDDTAAVAAAGYTLLPEAWYTIGTETPRMGGVGGTYNISLEAGEFGKQIKITIPDATLLDPSVTYGIGFTIASSDVNGIVATDRTLILEIGAKNIYDGRYELKGFHNRPTLTDPYDEEVHLITTGANSVKMYWPALGQDAHPIHGGVTYYSNFTTEFFFNAATNALINVENTYNPPATPFTIGPATTSRYDVATRTIFAQYYYNNNLERMFTDTLIYIGSR
jgi:hypothetical protein